MFSKTISATLLGLQPIKIEVEVNGSRGIPRLLVIGLPSQAVNEAKERVKAAISSVGHRLKSYKTVVNLAPADIKKQSAHLELAIAVGLLQMNCALPEPKVPTAFLGELSLDGTVKPIKGILPLVLALKDFGIKQIFLPSKNLNELALVKDVSLYGLAHLNEYVSHSRGQQILEPYEPVLEMPPAPTCSSGLTQILGQTQAKRALVIAAAGGHHLLLVGPPGTGKTTLATSLPSLLPPLSESAITEVSSLHSIAGHSSGELVLRAPFQSPSPSVSSTQLLGGGAHCLLGQVTLADQGVLFLDELHDFRRTTLEALRPVLDTRVVIFSQAQRQVQLPANCTVVAATNPCACGYLGSSHITCRCSLSAKQRYAQHLSGPFLDRLDLHVTLSDFSLTSPASTTKEQVNQWRQQIKAARLLQGSRTILRGNRLNAQLSAEELQSVAELSKEGEHFYRQACQKLTLSGRGYLKTLAISRTIADLEGSPKIQIHHVAEALQYRTPYHLEVN